MSLGTNVYLYTLCVITYWYSVVVVVHCKLCTRLVFSDIYDGRSTRGAQEASILCEFLCARAQKKNTCNRIVVSISTVLMGLVAVYFMWRNSPVYSIYYMYVTVKFKLHVLYCVWYSMNILGT